MSDQFECLLFVPSIAGISHHYVEDTKEDDIISDAAYLPMPPSAS